MEVSDLSTMQQTLSLTSTFSEWHKLYKFIEEFAHTNNIADETFQDLKLVTEEIIANIINHAYAKASDQFIEIRISANNNDITASFIDNAKAINPLDNNVAIGEDKDLSKGGMGMQIVKSLTDTQKYERIDERNVFTITKHYNN